MSPSLDRCAWLRGYHRLLEQYLEHSNEDEKAYHVLGSLWQWTLQCCWLAWTRVQKLTSQQK